MKPPYRVLSLDGGGIYGLFTCILLKKLCQKDKNFLKDDRVMLYAGTSAGALITLTLAQYESPREAILDPNNGVLDDLFTPGILYNNWLSPLQGLTSYSFWTAWAGREGPEFLLKQRFKDKTLGDLKQRVLITTFNLSGEPNKKGRSWNPKIYYNFPDDRPDLDLLVRKVAYGAISPLGWHPVIDGISDGGAFADNPAPTAIAKVVEEIRKAEPDAEVFGEVVKLLVDVHDRQNSMIRQVKASEKAPSVGFGKHLFQFIKELEGYHSTLENQSHDILNHIASLQKQSNVINQVSTLDEFIDVVYTVCGQDLTLLKNTYETCYKTRTDKNILEELSVVKQLFADSQKNAKKQGAGQDKITSLITCIEKRTKLYKMFHPSVGEILDRIHMLSLGVGNRDPYYWLENVNLGLIGVNAIPSNPYTKDFFPPIVQMLLEPSVEGAEFQAKQLLGPRFHRLNPKVLDFPIPPVLPAIYLARYTVWRNYIIRQIRARAERPEVNDALHETLDWLKYWFKESDDKTS